MNTIILVIWWEKLIWFKPEMRRKTSLYSNLRFVAMRMLLIGVKKIVEIYSR